MSPVVVKERDDLNDTPEQVFSANCFNIGELENGEHILSAKRASKRPKGKVSPKKVSTARKGSPPRFASPRL